MRKKNVLLSTLLAGALAFTMVPQSILAADTKGVMETSDNTIAKQENLGLVLRDNNMEDSNWQKPVAFDALEVGKGYTLGYEDVVESLPVESDTENYFHTTFKSLDTDIIQFWTENGLVNEFETKDTAMMRTNTALVKTNKVGTAKIECSVIKRNDPNAVAKTETITLTVKEATDTPANDDIKNIEFAVSNTVMAFEPTDNVYVRDAYYEYTATSGVNDYEYYWKNLTPEKAHIYKSGGRDGGDEIVEGQPTRGAVWFRALAPGKAHFQCTIVDGNVSRIVELYVDIKAEKGEEVIPPADKNDEITYVGSKDILADETLKNEVIDTVKNASNGVTINLGIKNDLSTITLPKDVLEAAKEKNIPLTVNVQKDGKTTTWTFKNFDNVVDVNLAMNVVKTSEIKELKDKDGLVFDFNHSGKLPTGTSVRTYVGDKFKAGQKVMLSYYDETSKSLKESKEYTVDKDGYVTVTINHCSKYVLQAKAITPETDKRNPGSVPTGDTTNIMLFTVLVIMSGISVYLLRKKVKA